MKVLTLTTQQQTVLDYLSSHTVAEIRAMSARAIAVETACSHQGVINAIASLYMKGYLVLREDTADGAD
jgi:hypothetical protein